MYHDGTYTKRALIPFWATHLVLLIIFIFVLSIVMMEISGDLGYCPAALAAFMALFGIALVLEPLEMVLQSYRYLEPWVYLSSQIFKTIISVAFFAYQIDDYSSRKDQLALVWRIVWILTVAFSGALIIAYLASMLYAIVVVHRHRKSRSRSDWEYIEQKPERADS